MSDQPAPSTAALEAPPPEAATPPADSAAAPSSSAPPPAAAGSGRGLAALALLLALGGLAGAGYTWIEGRERAVHLQEEVAKRLSTMEGKLAEARVLAERSQDATRAAEVRLSLLEGKLADSQSQQLALEALYQELSRNRDEWVVSEVEQILNLASQQLQLAGNVKSALVALQLADNRLQRSDKPQFIPLRKVLARDMERLRAVPYVDTAGFALRIDNLLASLDKLPLAQEARADPGQPVKGGAIVAGENAWLRFAREAWQDMRELWRVQRIDHPEAPLLTPSQSFYVRENLRLRLLSARIALLSREDQSFRADIGAAEDWLGQYFDRNAKPVRDALQTLHPLSQTRIDFEVPDISATVDAMRDFRLAHERAPK